MKTYHDIDPEEAVVALVALKNDPNFKTYIKMREAMREEVIRQLQTKAVIDSTNRHFMMTGKLEAIDEELDNFYKLWFSHIHTQARTIWGSRAGFFVASVSTLHYILLH